MILLRIVVGAVFVISGFAKAVDPWGFIFKIEDYMSAWSMTEPRTITFVVAVALSAYEFILGFMLLAGCFKRVAAWLLTLSMAFMLPLTAYIWIANPVDDCGCFGEMLKLSNAATFWKNVVLTAALLYLCRFNARFRRGIYRPAIQWLVGVVLMLYILVVAMYGYNVQPMVDFRSYPTDTDLYAALSDENADEAGSDADDAMTMVYERDGVQQTFSIDELPDSTWTFVKRVGQTETVDTGSGFTIYDVDNEDVTSDAISHEGEQLILVIPEANRVDIACTYAINEMYKAIRRSGGDMIALISATPEGIERWIDISMAEYPCYIVEDTALKQLSRGHMSMVYLKDGTIQWKRTLSAFDFTTIDALGNGTLAIADIEINDKAIFRLVTVIAIILLTVIALFQEFILRLLPGKQKKALTLHPDKENISTKQNKNCKEMRK
ncbi:MAG: DoxX family protein, partial [Bacteroides sp.]|nr:DoxX family protein [Bacteroides sp.]